MMSKAPTREKHRVYILSCCLRPPGNIQFRKQTIPAEAGQVCVGTVCGQAAFRKGQNYNHAVKFGFCVLLYLCADIMLPGQFPDQAFKLEGEYRAGQGGRFQTGHEFQFA